MKEDVSNLSNKLQEMVAEGGSNFSSGQRQVTQQREGRGGEGVL